MLLSLRNLRQIFAPLAPLMVLAACAHQQGHGHDKVRGAVWAEAARASYQRELSSLRAERPAKRSLPPVDFFLFGMGDRTKLIFSHGRLRDAATGATLRDFAPEATWLVPSEYAVVMRTHQGVVVVSEDEAGVSVTEDGHRTFLSRSPLQLPRFDRHRYPGVMRVLHHEILINIVNGQPLPNAMVYKNPWYRDAAMMAMVLERTGNLPLIKQWIAKLTSPFDRNNANEEEPDNPGQALYLISRLPDRTHPLLPALMKALQRFEVPGGYIEGRSDFALHPVYQTLWANFGLQSLGLPERYHVPTGADSYANLFWWKGTATTASAPRFSERDALEYPYLAWAQDHARGTLAGPMGDRDYPLSWEGQASQANYAGMAVIDPIYEQAHLAAPHTWHAAEMFLMLDEQRAQDVRQ